MILEFSVENFLSFKDEVTFSFEPTKEKKLEEYHIVEVAPGVKISKLGILYGANASGKSNLINVIDFLQHIWLTPSESKDEGTGVIPFEFCDEVPRKPTKFRIVFYTGGKKYSYELKLNQDFILYEKLTYYPSAQPALIFERNFNKNISTIEYGSSLKLTKIAKEEISIKCLVNMSVFSAYNQVNTSVLEIEQALDWAKYQFMQIIEPETKLELFTEKTLTEDSELKDKILSYLQEADFNIFDIHTDVVSHGIPEGFLSQIIKGDSMSLPKDEKERLKKEKTFEMTETSFEHKVFDEKGEAHKYELPKDLQSSGTLRVFGLAAPIIRAVERNAFLAIDEIESSLHPKLVEFILLNFLKESSGAQLLVTTHYDGLFDETDIFRKDNFWFCEKGLDGATNLFQLTDFNGLNRISSLQKAYKLGRFGAIPDID